MMLPMLQPADVFKHTLPGLVPRNEWEVHVKHLQSQLADLLPRIGVMERSSHTTGAHVKELYLHYKREFVSKQALIDASSRLDGDIAAQGQQTETGLQDLRSLIAESTSAVRVELVERLSTLEKLVETQGAEIARLESSLRQEVAASAATYTTKLAHDQACAEIRRDSKSLVAELRVTVEELRNSKANRDELLQTCDSLKSHHDSLQQEHTHTQHSFRSFQSDFTDFQRRAREELAKKSAVEELSSFSETMQLMVDKNTSGLELLRKDLDVERERLDKTALHQADSAKELGRGLRAHSELQSEVTGLAQELRQRCSKSEQALVTLDRRERDSWERFHSARK